VVQLFMVMLAVEDIIQVHMLVVEAVVLVQEGLM
jgi:hypothetical protein